MALDYVKITKYISTPRLHKYETVCTSNRRALKLYQSNLRLSQAFYPLLSLLEVVLRNAIDHELTIHFNDNNWLRNQRNRFMSDPSLTYKHWKTGKVRINSFLKDQIETAEKKIRKSKSTVTHSKIIADLKFGFWLALFDNTHYTILKGVPIRAFLNLPIGSSRQTVDYKLSRIRDFRNRVYHNESIIFNKDVNGNSSYDLSMANQVYTDIKDIFDWLNLDFIKWTKRIDNVTYELNNTNCVMNNYPSKKYYFHRLIIRVNHYKLKYSRN